MCAESCTIHGSYTIHDAKRDESNAKSVTEGPAEVMERAIHFTSLHNICTTCVICTLNYLSSTPQIHCSCQDEVQDKFSGEISASDQAKAQSIYEKCCVKLVESHIDALKGTKNRIEKNIDGIMKQK